MIKRARTVGLGRDACLIVDALASVVRSQKCNERRGGEFATPSFHCVHDAMNVVFDSIASASANSTVVRQWSLSNRDSKNCIRQLRGHDRHLVAADDTALPHANHSLHVPASVRPSDDPSTAIGCRLGSSQAPR